MRISGEKHCFFFDPSSVISREHVFCCDCSSMSSKIQENAYLPRIFLGCEGY